MAVFIKEDSAKRLKTQVHLNPKLTQIMTNKSNYYSEVNPKLQGFKRAKKIANAAQKETYNTSQDKFKQGESGVTLNYNEIKRWNNALKYLPANSAAFDANGGEEAKQLVGDLAKQVQRNNRKVDMVPEVEKLVDDVKVNTKEIKPSKIGNSDVYIESTNKRIYIKENQLHILKEDFNQLTIPFDNKYIQYKGKNIPQKYDYEYFIDWLETIGTFGKLKETPNINVYNIINQILNDNKEEICDEIISGILDGNNEIVINFLFERLSDEQNYYDKKYFIQPIEDVEEEIELDKYYMDLSDFTAFLTEDGKKRCDYYLQTFAMDRIDEYGFLSNINEKNGLIYIERVIDIPSLKKYTLNSQNEDFYHVLVNSYDGVGQCWTWSEGEGEAYCSDCPGGISIVLKGWASINDVDWLETIKRNGYELNHEKEIYMDYDAKVQIDEIVVDIDRQHLNGENLQNKKIPLPQSIIVPV